MNKDISIINNLYKDIVNIINESKNRIYTTVNSELVITYWNVGKIIKEEIIKSDRAEYGKEIVGNISDKLTAEFGRGFGKRNIFRMIKFYEIFSNFEIVPTLSTQLSWSHFVELISIEDDLKREFYITLCMNEKWSIRALKERKNSMLYERTALSKKPENTIMADLKLLRESNVMTKDVALRDPYILDFLGLEDEFLEKDLESAILKELEKFILEIGIDFAFLARQKRIIIDDKDYYIDLLFYHRKMRRLVVVELKLGEFKPEHKGQVELYLRWLKRYEKIEGEEDPIAIILCAEKKQETIELMELDKSGIHVAQYITQLPPKEVFEEKLHKAIVKARLQLEQRGKDSEI